MNTEPVEFIHIHNHYSGSTSDSILKIKDAIKRVKSWSHPALGITDHGKLSSIWPFYFNCRDEGIVPLIGCEIYFVPDPSQPLDKTHLVILAKNLEGLFNLIRLSSLSWENNFSPPDYALINWNLLERFRKGLMVLSACISGPIGSYVRRQQPDRAGEFFKRLEEMFGDDFYPEVSGHNLKDQAPVNRFIETECNRYGKVPVVTNDCHYLDPPDWKTHDIFLKTADKYPSDFAYEAKCFYLKSNREMVNLGFPSTWLEKSREICEKTTMHLELDEYLKTNLNSKSRRNFRRKLPIVCPFVLDPASALQTAGRVLMTESRMLKSLTEMANGCETLEECHRANRKFRAAINTDPALWRHACKLQGVVREFIPDYYHWIELDEKTEKLIPIRLIHGEPVADIDAAALKRLGIPVQLTRTDKYSDEVAFYGGYISWWKDDYDKTIDKLLDIDKKKRDVNFIIGDSYFRVGRYREALSFLQDFLRSGDISFHAGYERIARDHLNSLDT